MLQRLKFDGVGCNIGHIQFDQDFFGRLGVVIGGTPNEGKAHQRNHRVDGRMSILEEELLYRGAGVETRRKGGNYAQSARFEG